VRVDAPETLIATVDEPQVRQLLINLLRNALDALDARDEDGAPREIAVRLADEGDTFTLAVEDSGPGVPDDLADSIFEPFVTTRTSGTGLGLAISRQIARRHGGDLTVAPAALTRGAAFVMRCPTSRRNPSA
jgi:two-component system sensor kinase FixL